MDWQILVLIIFSSLIVLMLTGMPVAFCFLMINIAGMWFLFSGDQGLQFLIRSFFRTLAFFPLLPIPLFTLMGELTFHSGIGSNVAETVDKWLGRLPGRLGLLAVGTGTIMASLTGSSLATVALLGDVLVPEMEKRGYKKPMSLGPILGSSGLAIMIPPSGMAILLAAIGRISVGGILMAIIIPGLMMSVFYATYIILRCWLQPSIAPDYPVKKIPLSDKLKDAVRYILPLGLVVFGVIGVIFLGIATPSEAAATGVVATVIVALISGKMDWQITKKSILGTIKVTTMIGMIYMAAGAFSQILAKTQATAEIANFTMGLPVTPIVVIILSQVIVLIMGCFMEIDSIMMITLPIFMPIVTALGFNPVWYGAIFLLNDEMAVTTPPFGTSLFVMKGVAPKDTSIADIYKAAVPFLVLDVMVMSLMLTFPQLVLWLPSVAR